MSDSVPRHAGPDRFDSGPETATRPKGKGKPSDINSRMSGISQSTSVLFQDVTLLRFASQLRRNGYVEASWVSAVISIRARACGEVDRVSGGNVHG
jgi:hypothetical protein